MMKFFGDTVRNAVERVCGAGHKGMNLAAFMAKSYHLWPAKLTHSTLRVLLLLGVIGCSTLPCHAGSWKVTYETTGGFKWTADSNLEGGGSYRGNPYIAPSGEEETKGLLPSGGGGSAWVPTQPIRGELNFSHHGGFGWKNGKGHTRTNLKLGGSVTAVLTWVTGAGDTSLPPTQVYVVEKSTVRGWSIQPSAPEVLITNASGSVQNGLGHQPIQYSTGMGDIVQGVAYYVRYDRESSGEQVVKLENPNRARVLHLETRYLSAEGDAFADWIDIPGNMPYGTHWQSDQGVSVNYFAGPQDTASLIQVRRQGSGRKFGSNASVAAGGKGTNEHKAELEVTVLNNGSPSAGISVSAPLISGGASALGAGNSGGATVTPASAVTNAEGKAYFTFTSSNAIKTSTPVEVYMDDPSGPKTRIWQLWNTDRSAWQHNPYFDYGVSLPVSFRPQFYDEAWVKITTHKMNFKFVKAKVFKWNEQTNNYEPETYTADPVTGLLKSKLSSTTTLAEFDPTRRQLVPDGVVGGIAGEYQSGFTVNWNNQEIVTVVEFGAEDDEIYKP
jgi:hypothetical protein